tara:strand:+ start:1263 stop:1436 length:174 start_codon:yes stop_codon:yes gene_type:complete
MELPGSKGEHALQQQLGTRRRAASFYRNQVLDALNPDMVAFIVPKGCHSGRMCAAVT